MARFTGLIGLAVLLAVAYLLSTNRRAIKWRTVLWGLGLQVFFAILVIKFPFGQLVLQKGSAIITSLLGHSVDGSRVVFGYMGAPGPMSVFAFEVLPTIIFVSAFFVSALPHRLDADHHSLGGVADAVDDGDVGR